MSDVQTPKSGTSRRGLRIALVVSLMVNLLLIGVMIGGLMRVTHQRPPVVDPDMRALWHALPSEARDRLRARMASGGPEGGPERPISREERRALRMQENARILALLRAQPFDVDAFSAALDADHGAMRRRMDAARRAFAQQVGALTAAQRQEMATQLESDWAQHLPPPAHH